MSEATSASDRIAACFGLGYARTLVTTPLRSEELAIIHLDCLHDGTEQSVFIPPDDAFLVMLYLVDVDHGDIWSDRPAAPIKTYPKGSICLISLKNGAGIAIRSRLEALAFHIPAAHFAELANEAGEPMVESLMTCRGIDDQVVRNLGAAVLPMFDMPREVTDTLLAHIGLALNAHLANRYGRSPRQTLPDAGKLSTLQEKRVKSFMAANVSRVLSLETIADASGLSREDLENGFRASTGQSLEQWLRTYRVDRAKTLLTRTGDTMSHIAEACGFVRESDLIEIFTDEVGLTPIAWRSRDRH